MLGKMLLHGCVAAAIIGSAAAVYAQSKDNGYLSPDAVPARTERPADLKPADGYLRPDVTRSRQHEGEREHASDRRRDGRDRKHDRDHDDD